MIVVADAGPLIYLSAVGLLHVLRDLYGGVIVPREVYDEVVGRGQGEPGAAEVAASSWIQVSDGSLPSTLRLGLMTELDAERIPLYDLRRPIRWRISIATGRFIWRSAIEARPVAVLPRIKKSSATWK